MSEVIATKLFETKGVSAFKIPPGQSSLNKWNLNGSNIIWTGNLRVIEEELITDDVELFSTLPSGLSDESSVLYDDIKHRDAPTPGFLKAPQNEEKEVVKPYKGLRLKLELYNTMTVPPSVGNLTSVKKDLIWAEVWYNPDPMPHSQDFLSDDNNDGTYDEHDYTYSIANNGQDTIQMTESPKFYKVIAQIPGSGYHPFDPKQVSNDEKIISTDSIDINDKSIDDKIIQIALGLKFDESFGAVSFAESLGIYRRRYRNFEDQYKYELNLLEIEKHLRALTLDDSNSSLNKGNSLNDKDYIDVDEEIDDNDDNNNDKNFYEKNSNLFGYGENVNQSPRSSSSFTTTTTEDDSILTSHTTNHPESDLISRDPSSSNDNDGAANYVHDGDINDAEFGDFVQSCH